MKVNELIELINSSENCYSIWNAENLFKGSVYRVAANVYEDEHRWYVVSTNVYKCDDGYVGITGPSALNSESMVWSDCGYHCTAEEYEAFNTISYRPIER